MILAATSDLIWQAPIFIILGHGLIKYFERKRAEGGEDKHLPTKAAWRPLETVSISILIYFTSQLLTSLMLLGLHEVVGNGDVNQWVEESLSIQFVFRLINTVIWLGMIIFFIRRRRSNLQSIGLSRRPKPSDAGYALVSFGLYYAASIVMFIVVTQIFKGIDIDQPQQTGFENVSAGGGLILAFMSLVVLAPLGEEIFFRGFFYSGMRKGLSYLPATLVTAAVFGLLHLQLGAGAPPLWLAAIDTFVLSLFLVHLRERTGQLWAPITLHTIKNGLAFTVLFVI